jgi:HK97 family phage major capsid protein
MSETKELLDGIKAVGDKLDSNKVAGDKAVADVKTALEAKMAEAESIFAKKQEAFENQVKELNEELAKKGASLKDIADAVDQLKKRQGKFSARGGDAEAKNAIEVINELFSDHQEKFKGYGGGGDLEFKAPGTITLSNVTNLSGSYVNAPMAYEGGLYGRPTRKIQIRDLVQVIQTAANSLIYYRQPVTGAIGQGSFGFQAGQGNAKSQLDYNLQPVVVTPDYLAGYARIARQMLNDLPSFQSFISGQLVEDYRRSESAAFIPQLLAAATAYTAAATVTAEKIVQATADLMGKDWDPTGVVTDAPTYAKLLNTKPNDYGLPGGGLTFNIDANGNARFLGMPIVVSNNMTASQVIVGQFDRAAIIQNEGLSVGFFEQDQDNVIRNMVTARVEARVAFTVMRPDAFDVFTAGTT